MKDKKNIQLILEDGCKIIECDGVYSIIDDVKENNASKKISSYLKAIRNFQDKK